LTQHYTKTSNTALTCKLKARGGVDRAG